jgi:hypothetical protein
MDDDADYLTLEKLRTAVEPLLNDVCIIYDNEVGRLVGISKDEFDYYYIVDMLREKLAYFSVVGSIFSLKQCLPDAVYESMDNLLKNNGCAPVEQLIVVDSASSPKTDRRTIAPKRTLDYYTGVRDAANVVFKLPHTQGWQEITERLSDTDTQALAWRSGVAVLGLLDT